MVISQVLVHLNVNLHELCMHDSVKHDHEGMRDHVKAYDDINNLFWVGVETQKLGHTEDEEDGKDHDARDEGLLVGLDYAD